MMKNILLILTSILIGVTSANLSKAQVITGAYTKRTTIDRKPAPLPVVREADAIWSRTVWRIIDLREKANQHFYYPTRKIEGRSNLINLLLEGMKVEFTAFDARGDSGEFVRPITYKDLLIQQFGDTIDSTKVIDINSGLPHYVKGTVKIPTTQVKQFEIKEMWYFDKQKSTLQVRILGICPIREYLDSNSVVRKRLFWVRYPDIRPLLAKNESLNEFNGARSLSFDDIFLTRRFDGYIVKEENTYNNRAIEDYAQGEYAAKESDRIKNSIFNFEQDLWEY